MDKQENNKNRRRVVNAFLIDTFFGGRHDDVREIQEVGGYVLEKHWDGNINLPVVAILSHDSYERVREFREGRLNEYQLARQRLFDIAEGR